MGANRGPICSLPQSHSAMEILHLILNLSQVALEPRSKEELGRNVRFYGDHMLSVRRPCVCWSDGFRVNQLPIGYVDPPPPPREKMFVVSLKFCH